jgi:hypothetical protein
VRALRVALFEQTQRSFPHLEPRVLSGDRFPVEQTTRALKPPVGNGVLAAKGPAIPRQPHRHASRRTPVVARDIRAIGALSGIEHDVGEIEPPGGKAEAFERFGNFLDEKDRVERFACLGPRAASERFIAGEASGRAWVKAWPAT